MVGGCIVGVDLRLVVGCRFDVGSGWYGCIFDVGLGWVWVTEWM